MNVKLIPAPLAAAIARQADLSGGNPLREAQVFGVLIAAGYTASDIADLTGSTWCETDLRIGLLDLVDAAVDAMDEGLLPAGLAECIARLSEANQHLMLNRWLRGDFRNLRHAERYASAIEADEQPQASF